MRKPRAILHIGLEKTGTTSIQEFLFRCRDDLAARGFIVPLLPDPTHHHELCLLGQSDDPPFLTVRTLTGTLDRADLNRRREDVRKALANAVASPAAVDATFILSSEFLHSNLVTPGEVARLGSFLGEFFSDIDVVVYLRRQDRLAVSLFSSRLRGGQIIAEGTDVCRAVFESTEETLPYYYRFDEIVSNYAATFERERIRIRSFSVDRLVGGDVVRDFCAVCGIPVEGLDLFARTNRSLSPAALTLLMGLNRFLPNLDDGLPSPVRHALLNALEEKFSGAGSLIGRADARAVVAVCAAANRALARFMRLEAETPFDDDFEDYPEAPPLLRSISQEHARIVAHLLNLRLNTPKGAPNVS